MGPGCYKGQDGRTYRAYSINVYPTQTIDFFRESRGINEKHRDWPAAKAALDELIEEEVGEWVEFVHPSWNPRRFSRDGARAQRKSDGGEWHDVDVDDVIVAAYRKGLEVGRSEAQELIEATQRLPSLHLTVMDTDTNKPWAVYGDMERVRDALEHVHVLAARLRKELS